MTPPIEHERTGDPLPGLNGLDHVRVLVRDLEAAKDVFRGLGFSVPPRGNNFHHPLGTYQTITRLADVFYLELLAIEDAAAARAGRPEMARFLDRYEGGHSAILNVDSARDVAQHLAARGRSASAPVAGRFLPHPDSGPLAPGWWLVNFEQAPVRPQVLSFIQYEQTWAAQQAWSARLVPHPNTARGALAVWIAAPDTPALIEHLAALGLAPARTVPLPRIGAIGHEVSVGATQRLLVVEPLAGDAAAARFVQARGEAGVMGVSLAIEHLDALQNCLRRSKRAMPKPGPGPYGESVLIDGGTACGIALEFVGMSA